MTMENTILYLRPKQICQMFGIGRSTFWRLSRRKDFPRRTVLSPRLTLWPKEELIKFFAQLSDESERA